VITLRDLDLGPKYRNLNKKNVLIDFWRSERDLDLRPKYGNFYQSFWGIAWELCQKRKGTPK
jgi:predicted metal-dependent hydrolase